MTLRKKSDFKSVNESVVPIDDAADLVIVDEASSLWGDGDFALDATNAFVKLKPPPGTPQERVEAVRVYLLKAGAIGVVVTPQRAGKVVPDAAVPAAPRRRVREVVLALVEEARVKDRERLKEIAEQTMTLVNL